MAHPTELKVRGAALSGVSSIYLFVICLVTIWAVLLVWIPLTHFFPVLICHDWILAIPAILGALIMLISVIASFHTVFLDRDQIVVRWLGITVRRLPVSKLALLCAVGNGREDVLCLSCRTIDEMAQLQEEQLLRNALTKHDVVFRKRKATWKDAFAREYLDHLRRGPFGFFLDRDVVMLEMKPEIQYLLRHIYPHLPYRNYTVVTSCYASRFSGIRDDRWSGVFPLPHTYRIALEPDGIHVRTKKKEISFVPAQH